VSYPHITTVIPTYRRPELLCRAIQSVLAQSYPHLQVAVFDNASGDETAARVEEIRRRDPRVRYHCQPRNLGPARNFQAGLESVTTPYFAFLSDDDLVFPWFYEHAMRHLSGEPRARFFCGRSVRYEPDTGLHEVRPQHGWEKGFYESGEAVELMISSMFPWTGAVFATEVREKAGPLEDVEIADFLFLVKAAACFPFVISPAPCGVRVYWSESALRNVSAAEVIRSFAVSGDRLSRLREISAPQRDRLALVLGEKLARILGSRLRAYFLAGDWESVELAAGVLSKHRAMTPGKRLRSWLVRHRRGAAIPLAATRALFRLQAALRTRRRLAGTRLDLDQVVRRYGAPPPP